MDLVVSLKVCPRCVSWQSGPHCGDCGSTTLTPDTCSKCGSTKNAKFCTMCGAPTYGTSLDTPRARAPQGSQPVGTHTQIIYESSHTAEELAPSHIQRGQRIGYSATDTKSIFGSGITPSAVVKGKSGADDDPLARYRVNTNSADAEDNVDWHSTLRNASRANVEETGNPFHRLDGEPTYVNTPPPNYRTNQSAGVRPPSEGLRKAPSGAKAPSVPPHNVHTNVNVVPDPTIKPSALKDQGDYLEKYRVKSVDPTLTQGVTVSSNVRPSVLGKDQGDDYLEKYRVKTPEEEERTWEISLRNLPVSSNKIVELQVDDRQLYSGSGNDKVVSLNFSKMCNSTSSQFVVKIGLINFNLTRSLEIPKGRFVRFAVEQGQFKFRQQKTPFDD